MFAMLHLRTIIARVFSAVLAGGAVIAIGGPAEAASAGEPPALTTGSALPTGSTLRVPGTFRDNFACGHGPGGLKMTMQSDREMAQACAMAGQVANAYTAAPRQAGADQAVSVTVDGASWACVQKKQGDDDYVECSHGGEMLSLSTFHSVS
ncbi:hypothetical protein FE391_07015 [Nonomuraea sp. KC401]|uniref:hypothetical protein n=1 Tax=unclassified Nonomuraea TaxID=2593643 RepID=UPI0010FF3D12|nr:MULTISPECIES: hypothetical protein [unclassified Nonomuraea]NBE93827.1 hypothetical protein [Nonomuraea sp. K271]TLF80670.1 hypothetical protein FE391_07015 [Nonomuraea sp. KC401]